MTITFRCPWCKKLVGFDEKYSNRRAKCLSCQKRFIIPPSSDQQAQKVADEKQLPDKPVKGFCRAALVDTWSVLFSKNALGLYFWVVVGVLARFGMCLIGSEVAKEMTLSGGSDWIGGFGAAFKAAIQFAIVFACIIGIAVMWGRMWDWYISILSMTGIETDELIEPMEMGTLMFWYHGIKPFAFSALMVIAAGLPFFISMIIFDAMGWGYNLLQLKADGQIVIQVLGIFSVVILPSVFISLAINKDIESLKPSNILPPIYKRFVPYIFIALSLATVMYMDFRMGIYDVYSNTSMDTVLANFWYVLGLNVCIVILMRWMGLFYRYYGCYFKM